MARTIPTLNYPHLPPVENVFQMPSKKKPKETDRNIRLGDPNVYPVEKLLDSRVISRKTEYLVKWKEYSSDFNQWISAVNITPVLKKKFKEQRKLAKIEQMNENPSPKHGVNEANGTSPLPKKKLKTIKVLHPEIMKESSSTTPSANKYYNLRKRQRPSETITSRALEGSELDVLTIPIEKSQVIDFEECTSQISNESSEIQIYEELVIMSKESVLETTSSPDDSMILKMANKLDTEAYTAQTKLQGLTESQEKLRDEGNMNIISELDTCDLQMSNESKDVQIYKDSSKKFTGTSSTSFNMEAAIPKTRFPRDSHVCGDSDFIFQISSESSESSDSEGTMQPPENMIQKVEKKLDVDAYTAQTQIADMATPKTSGIEDKENSMLELNKIQRLTSNGSKTLQIFDSEICKIPSTFYIDSKNDKTTTKLRSMKKSRANLQRDVSDESDDLIYQYSYKIPRRATLESVLDIPIQSKAPKVLLPMRKEDLEDEDDERYLLGFDVSMSPVLL